jgi:DNA-directed RNA polymerase specialized sigma24 family protein
MARCTDKTTTRGYDAAFHTTHWTEILEARSDDEDLRQAALTELLKRYWKPVYCYLRRKGYDRESAKDLSQGFFHEIVLGRSLIQHADRSKGRFRTFLLMALDRYVTSALRTETRKRRMPEGGLISLDDVDWLAIPDRDGTPTQVFDYAWASTLLDEVVAEVAEKCRDRGSAPHWELFEARVLRPIFGDAEFPSLDDLCEKHGISRKTKASNMIFAVKRRFRTVLRRAVRHSVDSDGEVDDEISYLVKVLSRGAERR